jgi:hypothetical protein
VAAAEVAARQREALGAAVCVASPALRSGRGDGGFADRRRKAGACDGDNQAVSATGSSIGASALSGMPST